MKTSRSPNRVSLPRALSKLGFASRTTANKLIADGSVLVNGQVELNPHRWVNLQSDRIAVAGTELVKTERRYVILNKPPGVVTTASDERGRTTVVDLLGEEGTGIAPVGRLDKETSGLILLTNDNELANFLTSPESGLPKTYAVVVDKKVDREDLSRLRQGISITVNGQEYRTKPAETRLMDRHAVELTITEGKNRQVRKMFEELGYQIV
ncbi:MAG: pseudouridine synthase, partial [Bacteroidota bacterium]